MSDIKDGGRAFPWCGDLNETPFISLGMTLRDYFAAKAMAAIAPNFIDEWSEKSIAETAYSLADAMLRARES
ncbi:hypothetical protein [Burkholderia latens]|uniref:hypothetical protein n=1 Tax=Burkholderia latens TaxID=488446 RepID=UPI001AE1DC3A|nr:hypothetical protein [Burkholderia latens]QTO46364.1 hypothetical protein J8I85_18130 [Burkholderia latens]